jgi:hypothetical protein
MSQYQVDTKLLTGRIRYDTDVSLQYSKTDDRILDCHNVSNRYEQIKILTDENN